MRAVVWHGKNDVRVDEVADPTIEAPTDAVIQVTSTAICGSDLHLYTKLWPVMDEGDILGHEAMGVVVEVGSEVTHIRPGDRVVVPFNIACGWCLQCQDRMYSQCETTQNTAMRKAASLFGYTKLYGHVPGAQAEYLRVPQAHFGPIKVPDGASDLRFVLLSDVLPTAWQAVEYAGVRPGDTVSVHGLGPVGQMAARMALFKGAARVIGVDRVPERLQMAARHGVETIDFGDVADATEAIEDLTGGGLCHAAIDAVGMEASGGGSLRDSLLQATKVQPDKLAALHSALGAVRRGGTLSIAGVYGGPFPMFPLGDLFDKQITLRMGQANVKRWVDDIIPLLLDGDPLGVDDLITHRMPIEQAPYAYEIFQKKMDGCVKVVLEPAAS
jgi:threonine dehydrogenase-like Zn-dependent dehydrogenase